MLGTEKKIHNSRRDPDYYPLMTRYAARRKDRTFQLRTKVRADMMIKPAPLFSGFRLP